MPHQRLFTRAFLQGLHDKKEVNYLAALADGVECKKITLRSKTPNEIYPSSDLTSTDISAVNTAYPDKTTTNKEYSLPPLENYRTFTLVVEELERVAGTTGESGAICGELPDFIGEMVIGDVLELDTGHTQDGLLLVNDTKLSKTKKKDKVVGNTVTPNWTLDVPVAPDTKELYIIVKAWEYDEGAACGGKNDLVDISPLKDQGYLRLIANLETGELQHVRPQQATAAGNTIYFERARFSGKNIFDNTSGQFVSNTFSGTDDIGAANYQMEAKVKLKGSIQ